MAAPALSARSRWLLQSDSIAFQSMGPVSAAGST